MFSYIVNMFLFFSHLCCDSYPDLLDYALNALIKMDKMSEYHVLSLLWCVSYADLFIFAHYNGGDA